MQASAIKPVRRFDEIGRLRRCLIEGNKQASKLPCAEMVIVGKFHRQLDSQHHSGPLVCLLEEVWAEISSWRGPRVGVGAPELALGARTHLGAATATAQLGPRKRTARVKQLEPGARQRGTTVNSTKRRRLLAPSL